MCISRNERRDTIFWRCSSLVTDTFLLGFSFVRFRVNIYTDCETTFDFKRKQNSHSSVGPKEEWSFICSKN